MRKQLSGGGFRVLLSLFVLCLAVGVFLRYSEKASSQKADTNDVVQSGQAPVASQAVAFGISQAVRDLPEMADPNWELDPERAARAAARRAKQEDKIKNPFNAKTIKNIVPGAGVAGSNYAFRDEALPDAPAQPSVLPTPGVSFEGLSSQDNQTTFGTTFAPPDTVGDVGPNHYVQMTNTLVRIFNKNGTPASAPFLLSSITNVVGGPCVNMDDGDPIVNYDPLANRWILSQFCPGPVPGHQMFAVSTTPDPTGSYYVYDFVNPSGSFFDYPHVGVWPDAYYMTVNQFNQAGTAFLGAGAFAYDRVKMLQGDPTASYVYFDQFGSICPTCGGQLPTDLDGTITPPAGMGNLIMEYTADEFGDAADGLRIFEFKPNFTTPASSTFTQVTPDLGFAAFDARQPTGRTDVEQPGTATNLDSIADRLMFRVAYRNLGTVASPVNSWVMNFTVNVGGATPASAATYQAGIRWAEIRRAGANGAFSVANQGTQATNPATPAGGTNSWMGSVAQDKDGNILLGYSTSGSAVATDFPSLKYAGRQASDPANTFQAQVDGFLGTGFQAGAGSRWGDYSAMSVDPTDECSFWYTQEYRSAANNGNAFLWNTRVLGNIKFPTCTAPSRGTVSGTITSCASGLPLANAVVTLAGGFLATTNASGQYTIINVPPGTTSASATKSGGFSVASNNSVVVAGGATTNVNLCLAGVPVLAPGTVTIVSESCLPANGAVDPGETVTVSLPVLNTGGANTVNDVGTLAASGGVLTPSAAQNYGVVTSGGAAVSRNYTFTASPSLSCGTNITATVAHQDGASSLGNVVYTIPTGAVSSALSQNFDSVTVPALPADWVATNVTGAGALWVTATGSNHTAPNVAFVDDPASVTDKVLDTPSLTAAAGSQLSFRHAWTLESGFDGGVLEISINGGAFADILAAGGSFVAGGYTGPISASFASPIAGRQAWTGTQAAFVTTTVNLPAAAAGQPIRLRFRMASDSSVSGTGWRVDTVTVSSRSCCGAVAPTPTPTVVPTPTPTPAPTPTPGACTFSNGGLLPRATSESGVAAPAGFFFSELQHNTGVTTEGNGSAGFTSTQGTFRLADNFTIAQPCTISTIAVYGYLTGSAATPSPFTAGTLQIWNGRPGDAGATVVFGDTTTNRLASSVDTTYFRLFNSVVPAPGSAPGTTRKIWRNTLNVNAVLPAGTYWIDWATTVTGAAAHFAPAKTIAGARGAAGDNARQQTVSTGLWTDVADTGAPAAAADIVQDLPFDVVGTSGGVVPTPTPTPVATPTPVPTPTPTPGAGTTVSYTGPSVTIPDNLPAGVNIPVAVGTACTITDLNFRFDGTQSATVGDTGVGVTHSWVGDLVFKLTSPTGTAVTFYDRPGVPASAAGCNNNNLAQLILDDDGGFPSIEAQCNAAGSAAAFPTGSFSPNNPLSAFDGQSAVGTWTLNVNDNAAADTGTVNRFSLVFTCAGGGPTPTPTPAPTATPTPTPVPTTFVAFSSTTYKEDESQSATVTVNRTGVTTGVTNATVTLTSGGRAVGGATCATGVDYQNTAQAVSFAAGETSKTVTIPLCGDISADTDETVNLTLTNLSALTGASNSAVLTINDTANQFKNPAAISIIQGTAAGLYPSPIVVTGATTNAFRIRVTLYDFYSTKPDNLDVLLVGPNGAKYALVGDVGGPVAITEAGAVTLTLADYPNAVLPDSGPLATGIFKPTTCETPVSNFPAPAPAGPYVEPGCVVARTNAQTLFGNFGGSTANGTWNLYIRDDNGVARPDAPEVVNGEVKGGWGIELLPSTAAGVEVSGRVLTPDGRGLRNATVTIIDSMGNRRTATTGSFGYYQFADVEAGGTYTVGVSARRYRFTSRILQVQDTLTDVDFVGQE
ncbi:MAG TPA: carboxypeptidase regulatory-like domain-containing protein [Pyrinomonadaceae bacterium]|nr:carboxypeptidase regulatory-like domain-containing protein [Pyrinomonadaceae bacterium]